MSMFQVGVQCFMIVVMHEVPVIVVIAPHRHGDIAIITCASPAHRASLPGVREPVIAGQALATARRVRRPSLWLSFGHGRGGASSMGVGGRRLERFRVSSSAHDGHVSSASISA